MVMEEKSPVSNATSVGMEGQTGGTNKKANEASQRR